MQQHLMQIQPMMAAYYPTNVTTDHIQQYLDENKSLILKIVESQNLGKMNECAENQARLQRNLMYLAAIADSQPQPSAMHSQYATSGILQPGAAHYMQQHQQAAAAAAQQMSPQSLMSARSSMLYGASQPYPSLQQQAMHGAMGSGQTSGLMLQGDPHVGSGVGLGVGGFPEFIRGGSSNSDHGLQGGNMRGLGKQDLGSGGSGEGRHDGGGETLFLKSADEGN